MPLECLYQCPCNHHHNLTSLYFCPLERCLCLFFFGFDFFFILPNMAASSVFLCSALDFADLGKDLFIFFQLAFGHSLCFTEHTDGCIVIITVVGSVGWLGIVGGTHCI